MRKYAVITLLFLVLDVFCGISFADRITCPHCNGSGKENCITCHGSGICPTCNGARRTYIPGFGGGDGEYVYCQGCHGSGKCWECNGNGKQTCSRCSGRGYIDTSAPAPENGNENGQNTGGTLSIGGYLWALKVGDKYPENDYGELRGKATVSGGTPPYNWSVVKGELPKGLCLAGPGDNERGYVSNEHTGAYVVLEGIPALGGTYNFTLQVKDSTGASAEQDFTVEIEGGNIDELVIGGELHEGLAGDYEQYVDNNIYVSSGGREPLTWSKAGGALPEGMEIETRRDSLYTNMHRAALVGFLPENSEGRYNFTVKVVDADGRSVKKSYTFVCRPVYDIDPLPEYGSLEDSDDLPAVSGNFTETVNSGAEYSSHVEASAGTAPYTWSVSYGELPPGVTLSCSDSETSAGGTGTTGKYAHLTGKPEAAGHYNFVLKVTDSNNFSGARTFTVKVNAIEADTNNNTGNNNTGDDGNTGNNNGNTGNNNGNTGNNNTGNNNTGNNNTGNNGNTGNNNTGNNGNTGNNNTGNNNTDNNNTGNNGNTGNNNTGNNNKGVVVTPSGSGGGCNSRAGLLGLAALLFIFRRSK